MLIPKVGAPTCYFGQFFLKLHENVENLAEGAGIRNLSM